MSFSSTFYHPLNKEKEDKLTELKTKLSDYMLRYPDYQNIDTILSYLDYISSTMIPNSEYNDICKKLSSLIEEYRVFIIYYQSYISNYLDIKVSKIAELKSLLYIIFIYRNDFNEKTILAHIKSDEFQILLNDVYLLINNDTINYSIDRYNEVISQLIVVINKLENIIPFDEKYKKELSFSHVILFIYQNPYNQFRSPVKIDNSQYYHDNYNKVDEKGNIMYNIYSYSKLKSKKIKKIDNNPNFNIIIVYNNYLE